MPRGRPPNLADVKQLTTALAFVLALVATLTTVRLLSDIEPTTSGRDILHEKLAHLRAAQGSFDIVFVGNSHVYRTVNIEVFDAEMASLDCPVRSYNLGIQALTIAEQKVVLDAVAELPGGAPEFLVLGPTFRFRPMTPDLSDVSISSFYRARDIDDLLSTWVDTERLQGRRLLEAAYVYAAAQVPYGALHHRLWDERIETRTGTNFVAGIARDGYVSLEDEAIDRPATDERRQTLRDFVADGGFERAVDPGREIRPTPPLELQRLEARLTGAGTSTPVLLLQPTVLHREMAALEAAWTGDAPIVNLARPEAIPALLEPEGWFDRTHLTADAAADASRELARQMCAIVQGET